VPSEEPLWFGLTALLGMCIFLDASFVDSRSLPRIPHFVLTALIGVHWWYRDDLTAFLCVWTARGAYAIIASMLVLAAIRRHSLPARVTANYVFLATTFLLVLVSHPRVCIGYGLTAVMVGALQRLWHPDTNDARSIFPMAFLLYHVGQSLFYATGHQSVLHLLDWSAAFVGVGEFNWYAGIVLVTLNTFASNLLMVVTVPTLSSRLLGAEGARSGVFLGGYLILVYVAIAIGATVTVAVHRRHLMMWEIFCPKWCYAVVGASLVSAGSCVVTLLDRPSIFSMKKGENL